MYNYELQLDYPEDYQPAPLYDGFDLNDREKVEVLVNEALERLSRRKSIRFTEAELLRFGGAIELTLQDDLQGVDDRKALLDYVVDNYHQALEALDKISSGIDAIRSKQESPLTFDEEERT
jgi:hypothetical protein